MKRLKCTVCNKTYSPNAYLWKDPIRCWRETQDRIPVGVLGWSIPPTLSGEPITSGEKSLLLMEISDEDIQEKCTSCAMLVYLNAYFAYCIEGGE